jgi:catechol 2,3-dioxygenase-like lactoylglutathione lyase family enzyme
MFDHVALRTASFAETGRAYRRLLGVLGAAPSTDDDELIEWEDFDLSPADAEHPVTSDVHIGLAAPSREVVDAFWRAGIEAGLRDDGAPGPRTIYTPDYYGGFLRDADGNSIEACLHARSGPPGHVDHVWMRVTDVAASRDFYAVIAPYTGFHLVVDEPVTRNLHLAFPANDDATVAAFHRTAVAAGHRDNGAAGERPEYHPGYVGAFVLDPDGNNIEVVNHDR